jgi:hypothetical protein
MKRKLILYILFVGIAKIGFAQSDGSMFGNNKFLLTGNAEALFVVDTGTANFTNVNFKPIFLWKLSDKLFVESEVEIETGDGDAHVGLEYVNMCYIANPYLTLHMGRFLPKFGAYRGKLGEAYINRFATDPIGFGDGGIGPMNEVGVGAQGGIPLGLMRMNYDVWISNGPQVAHDETTGDQMKGDFEYEAYTDNNKDKAYGGRVGLLPFHNSSLEVGFSYEHASRTGDQYTLLEKTALDMMALDLNYYKNITPLKSTIRVIGEWKSQNEMYPVVADVESYSSMKSTFYGTVSIRPSLMQNKILRNLELAFRYSEFNLKNVKADNVSTDEGKPTRTCVALDYWFKWNCVLKLMWQKQTDVVDQYFLQMVYGF